MSVFEKSDVGGGEGAATFDKKAFMIRSLSTWRYANQSAEEQKVN